VIAEGGRKSTVGRIRERGSLGFKPGVKEWGSYGW